MTTAGQVSWYGDDLLKAIRDNADESLFEGGLLLAEVAAAKAPKRTGNLRNSAYVSTRTKSNYVQRHGYKKERKPEESGSVVVGFSAPHSHLVEFGTKNMSAKPYLRPTLDELKSKIGEKIVVKWAKLIR